MSVAVHVSVGSNIRPEHNVPEALALLEQAVGPITVSDVLVTAAIDRPEQPDYWNCVVAFTLETGEDAASFTQRVLREIEDRCGRTRTDDTYAARSLDLDIITWGGSIVSADVAERDFLVAGLAQLGGPLPPGAAPGATTHRQAPWRWPGSDRT